MSRFQRLQEFQESSGSTFLGVLPLAAVAKGEHETVVFGSIALYSDHSAVPIFLQISENHPEVEWRRRGRGGHPSFIIRSEDDLGTEYVTLPGGGGGGVYRYEFNQMIIPAIPDEATMLTISLYEISWEMPWHEPMKEDENPAPRWRVTVDPSNRIAPTVMDDIQ